MKRDLLGQFCMTFKAISRHDVRHDTTEFESTTEPYMKFWKLSKICFH